MSRELHDFYHIEKILWAYSVKKGKGVVYDGSTDPAKYFNPMDTSVVKFDINGTDDYIEFVKKWKEAYASVSAQSREAKINKDRAATLALRKAANVLLWIRREAVEVGNVIHNQG